MDVLSNRWGSTNLNGKSGPTGSLTSSISMRIRSTDGGRPFMGENYNPAIIQKDV